MMKKTIFFIFLLFSTIIYAQLEEGPILISGAGTAVVNGTYTKQGVSNGVNYYSNGTAFLYRLTFNIGSIEKYWRIGTALNANGTDTIYYTTTNIVSDSPDTPIGKSYNASLGTLLGVAPAPTLSLLAPSVSTTNSSSIATTSATLGGNITNDNGFAVTERGIVYSSTDSTPTIGEADVTKDTNGTGTGVFSKSITGLADGTLYYYKAYAINSSGTGYGAVKTFTTLNIANIVSIVRQTPVAEETTATTVTFRATFDGVVKNVDITDFTINSTAGGSINSVTAISTSVYDVEITGLSSAGTIGLGIKGVDGVTGVNDILTQYGDGIAETLSVNQSATNDYLNQAKIGQTFTATTNGNLTKFTIYPKAGNHTFAGTVDLKIYSGDESAGGATLLFTESISITSSTDSAGQIFILGTPQSVTVGNTYSIVLDNFSGAGAQALESNTAVSYTDGHVIFTGQTGAHSDFDLKIKIYETGTPFSDGPALATTAPTTNETYTRVTTPVVTTTVATNVTATSADLAGDVTGDAGFAVTERGILYSTTDTNPKIGDASVTKDANGTGTGVFTENITGFTANTIYYYRAYATNSNGTGYGAVKSFSLNNALHFLNGNASRVTIADHAAFDFSGGFTAEAWIRPDVLNTRNVFSQYKLGTPVEKAFSVFVLASGRLEFTVTTDGSTDLFFETNTTIAINTWTHVAFTFDGTTMKAYINGIASGTKAVTGTMFNSTGSIEIGARNNAHFFDGAIDEVRFWTRALTVAEINAQKDGALPAGTANGLAAYYKMNQGIAVGNNTAITTLTDSGPNGLDGTLNSFIGNGPTSNFVTGVIGTFTGVASNVFTTTGNWSNPANWSLGVVPTQVEGIIIEAGKTITIDVDNLVVDDFELKAGATLNIPKGKEITVQNSFVSNGTLDLGSDAVDSGVLLIEGASTGTVTYNRGGLLANKWSIVTPPVSGQTVKIFAENAANDIRINTTPNPDRYAIGFYDDAQAVGNKWAYFDADVNASTEFVAGQSYAISRNTNGAVAFVGTLQTENLDKTLVADQWSAIGNPYTTYFPANKNGSSSFLNDNLAALDDAFKSLYLWDVAQNKYVAVTEVDATDRSLPPGQGFFVRMKVGQTAITFNQEKRSTKPASGTTDFSRTTNATPSIVLKISNGTTTVKTDIKYFDTATQGLDPGYDIGNFNSASFDIFTHLLQSTNGTNFTIQSLPTNNYENMLIPIGIKGVADTEITFSSEAFNLPPGIKVVLEDRMNNTYTELSNNGSYTITLSADTDGVGQFYLQTTSSALNIDNVVLEGITIYKSSIATLKIIGLQEGQSKVTLFNLLGKKVQQTSFISGGTKEISLEKLSRGIYIVNLQTKRGSMTKKIAIQ